MWMPSAWAQNLLVFTTDSFLFFTFYWHPSSEEDRSVDMFWVISSVSLFQMRDSTILVANCGSCHQLSCLISLPFQRFLSLYPGILFANSDGMSERSSISVIYFFLGMSVGVNAYVVKSARNSLGLKSWQFFSCMF